MQIAFLILTTRCNRRCSYCFYETGYQARKDPDRVMPVEDGLLSALRGVGIDKLILTGGEPLILPHIAEIVEKTCAHGFSPLLLTNGELLSTELLGRLVRSGLKALTLSLDSLAPGSGSPEAKAPWDVLDLVKDYMAQVQAAVITPITRANLASLPEIINRISGLGLYLLLQPVFVPKSHELHSELSLRECTGEEQQRFLDIIDLWESSYGPSSYARLLKDFYTQQDSRPPYCLMGTESIVVDSTGEVLPCFHRRDLAAGNLLEDDPAQVIERARRKGDELRPAPCFGEHCISLFSHL
ncbi:MAG: radical SAM protein [Planctomycetota bacterium]